jgi:hypothetical protein
MHRLLRIGFQSVGYWELDARKADAIKFVLRSAAPHDHTLYAFVLDGDVKYVGKTTRTLAGRMNNYMRGPGKSEPATVAISRARRRGVRTRASDESLERRCARAAWSRSTRFPTRDCITTATST